MLLGERGKGVFFSKPLARTGAVHTRIPPIWAWNVHIFWPYELLLKNLPLYPIFTPRVVK